MVGNCPDFGLKVFLDQPVGALSPSPCALFDVCDRPTCGVAGTLLFFFLNLNPHQGKSFRDHIKEFDFLGLATVVSGVVCLLLGFNSSEMTCTQNP